MIDTKVFEDILDIEQDIFLNEATSEELERLEEYANNKCVLASIDLCGFYIKHNQMEIFEKEFARTKKIISNAGPYELYLIGVMLYDLTDEKYQEEAKEYFRKSSELDFEASKEFLEFIRKSEEDDYPFC